MDRKNSRILVGHTFWGRGGAEVAAMWLLQALCPVYRVDMVTRGGWNLPELNRISGTRVSQIDIVRIRRPSFARTTFAGALWVGVYKRYLRRLAPEYDLCVTASRVEDWGRAAIHFLSDVTWNVPLQKRFKCPSYHYAPAGSSALRRLYLALGRAIAGNSRREPAAHDLFVANSRWNAEISSEFCKREPAVICPAVPGALASVPWEERDSAFVCLGRIAPEKQVERAIRIIEQVRQAGHPVRLHLIGGSDDGCYAQEIRALCEARAEWIEQHGALYGERKFELLSGCRYGISSCECEAFGIATAEMMKAGLIPFVPRTGGQSEVVQQEALVYGGVQEAVLKIRTVLNAESRQADLQTAMLSRGEEFRPEAFCRAVQELVAKELRALDCERNDTTPCR